MAEEIVALENNHVWTIEDLSLGKKPIRYKWIYCFKYNASGSIQ